MKHGRRRLSAQVWSLIAGAGVTIVCIGVGFFYIVTICKMPAPTTKLSTDAMLYDAIYDPLAKRLCFLDPNWVTVACFAMIAPLIYGLYKKWPLWLLLVVIFVRQSLDCLDGAIARACNRKSWLGAFLDCLEDTLSIIIFGAFVLWILATKKTPAWIYWSLVGLWLFGVDAFTNYTIKTYNNEKFEMNAALNFVHDNTMLISMAIVVIVHALW